MRDLAGEHAGHVSCRHAELRLLAGEVEGGKSPRVEPVVGGNEGEVEVVDVETQSDHRPDPHRDVSQQVAVGPGEPLDPPGDPVGTVEEGDEVVAGVDDPVGCHDHS